MSRREQIKQFFTRTPLGRALVFLSLPAALLAVLLWDTGNTEPSIVDVQVHYNREAWDRFRPRAIINTLDELNVINIVVSSTPNEGTFKLIEQGQGKVIPLFQPYRTRDDRDNWFQDPEIIAYMEKEIRNWSYRGIGEFHLYDGQVDTPVVRRMVELASEYDLVLSAHSDPAAIRQLFELSPKLRVLWAHAGMTASPAVIGRMLDTYPNLRAELSHRLDVAPYGKLDPAWRELLLRHPDRFMVGTGTYSNEYWYQFRYTLNGIRGWLAELPPDVADQIAYKNALRLFAGT